MNSMGWVGGSSNLIPAARNTPSFGMVAALCRTSGRWADQTARPMGLTGLAKAASSLRLLRKIRTGRICAVSALIFNAAQPFGDYGRLTALRGLPGGRNALSIGINNLGQIVGWAENGIRDSSCATATAFQVYRFAAVKWETKRPNPNAAPAQGRFRCIQLRHQRPRPGSRLVWYVRNPGSASKRDRIARSALGTRRFAYLPRYSRRCAEYEVQFCQQHQSAGRGGRDIAVQRWHRSLLPVDKDNGYAGHRHTCRRICDDSSLLSQPEQQKRSHWLFDRAKRPDCFPLAR